MTATEIELQPNRGNLLLSHIAVHERNAIHRGAEAVSLAANDVLLRADTHSEFVFFPINCVASVIRNLRDGSAIEVALIGNEGMIGLDVFMEAKKQLDDVIVQSAGWAYRLPAEDLRNQFRRAGGLQRYLLRFTDALLTQVSQTAVCSRYHTPEARLARWLLMIRDRTTLPVVQAGTRALRTMLGSTEELVNVAVEHLTSAEIIRVRHDTITILDVEGLEVTACECYETLRQAYERTLSS